MLEKLALLVQSKVAIAVVGAALVGGGGTAVAVVATGGQLPFIASSHGAIETPGVHDNEHAHSNSIEGVLKGYDAKAATIQVQGKQDASPTMFTVNENTKVDGRHANSLADLAHNIGSEVEVQATKQSDGTLLALKVTVQGDGNGDANSADELHGKVVSVDATNKSFQIQLGDGTTKTVTLSAQTEFEGGLKGLDGLSGQVVTVRGIMQTDGTFAAKSVDAESESQDSTSGSGDSSHDGGGSQSGQQPTQIMGTIVSVSGSSFVLKLSDGTTKVVNVTSQTAFKTGLSRLADLRANIGVSVTGTMAADDSITAMSIEIEVQSSH